VSAEINGEAIGKTIKFSFLLTIYYCRASFKIISIQTVVPIAANATMAAAIAKTLSMVLIFEAAAGAATGRRATGAAAGAAAVVAGRCWATGAAEERKVVEEGGTGGGGAPVEAPVGPPGGSVGNLMVGADVGLGGKLIRTVSFFG
jgi:hypothetical protein